MSFLLLLLLIPKALAQRMTPDPTFDCSNPNFQVIYTACSAGDYSRCCAVGTSCCAGGCCDLVSNCLNVGTSNEICCPASDPTLCGQGGSGTFEPFATQSVVCTGSTGLSSYYCPPGATCDSAEDKCIGGSSSTGSGGSVPQQPAAAPSSSSSSPLGVPQASSSIEQKSSSTSAAREQPSTTEAATVTVEQPATPTDDETNGPVTVTATSMSSANLGVPARADTPGLGLCSAILFLFQLVFTSIL